MAVPPAIKTLPFVSKVAVCPSLSVVIFPVAVNLPMDWAFTTHVWPAPPKMRSGSMTLVFISCLLPQCNRHLIHRPLGTDEQREGHRRTGVLGICRYTHVHLEQPGHRTWHSPGILHLALLLSHLFIVLVITEVKGYGHRQT